MATNQRAPQSIADLLRDAIDESGETIYRIAKDAGVSESALGRFYNGHSPTCSLDTAEKLLHYFGFEVVRMRKGGKR